MNAVRKSRLFVLFGLVAALLIGVTATSAEAGGCHSSGYGYFGSSYCNYTPSYSSYTPSYCNYTPAYCNYTPSYCSSPSYCNYGTFDYSCYQPATYVAKPACYPVTTYNCYGQPVVVWQNSGAVMPTVFR